MQVVFDDSRLNPIRDKVEAGERLSFEDGVTLYRTPDILALGYLANLVRERLHGVEDLLQRQPAYQSHRCVRGQLPPVRVRQAGARPQGVHHVAGRGLAARRRRLERGRHRIPHRRRAAPGTDPGLVLRDASRPQAALSHRALEGVHHGGDRLPRAAHQNFHPRNAGASARRRHGFPARRRRRDLQRTRAAHHLRSQNRWQRMAGDGPHRPPVGPALQLHHAIRPPGERRGPRRPPGPPARLAGRNSRLRDLHSAGLPSRQYAASSTSRRPPGSTTSRTSRWPA